MFLQKHLIFSLFAPQNQMISLPFDIQVELQEPPRDSLKSTLSSSLAAISTTKPCSPTHLNLGFLDLTLNHIFNNDSTKRFPWQMEQPELLKIKEEVSRINSRSDDDLKKFFLYIWFCFRLIFSKYGYVLYIQVLEVLMSIFQNFYYIFSIDVYFSKY